MVRKFAAMVALGIAFSTIIWANPNMVLFDAQEYGMGNIIFENTGYEFLILEGTANPTMNFEFDNFNYGYNLNIGRKNGFSLGMMSRMDTATDTSVSLQYLNYRTPILGAGIILKDFKRLFGIGVSTGFDIANLDFRVLAQGNFENNKMKTVNIGAKATLDDFTFRVGQSGITLDTTNVSPGKSIQFGLGCNLRQFAIDGAAGYDFEKGTLKNIKLSVRLMPFGKEEEFTKSSERNESEEIRKKELELQMQKERDRTAIAIIGIIAGIIIPLGIAAIIFGH